MRKKKNKSILIVEDNKALNATLVDILEKENFDVFNSFNGEEGLKVAYNEHPDLIILDIRMPVLDGHGFMDQLREDKWGKKAKVIILTNYSIKVKDVAKTVIQKDPVAFLVKTSTRMKDLINYVHFALDEKTI